ncbi:SPL family radical SAM protein [Rubellicoccus peritrichatus]|uniref:Spore photoproduct lyase n=1 Tax=Rubellicoccus peritrichatus TaxID=3080537 RepID=A0AAQ3L9L2_9BACT|nr:hypothetical protein [Puniceicoccus sp. CR14]WOO39850.1 hypothetical protein RZN69_14590 [Puniceicoccus sp. CR14]
MKFAPHFSRIYVEKDALKYPFAQQVLDRFSKANLVYIDDYRNVFNRSGQDFRLQKASKSLILAKKKDNLLYDGNAMVQDFGYRNFAYNTPVLNCIYDCAYCYLQGMFSSANLVAFVNTEDFFDATKLAIAERPDKSAPLHLALSYDTDLLASETILPFCCEWIEFCRNNPDLVIEIRTKSANLAPLADIRPLDRCILAWTMTPPELAERYETDAPKPEKRLIAATKAIDAGWPVRLCFDPVLPCGDWDAIYSSFYEEVFSRLSGQQVLDASLGVFRINHQFYTRLKKNRPNTDLVYRNWTREGDSLSLPSTEREKMLERLTALLRRYLPQEKIAVWM